MRHKPLVIGFETNRRGKKILLFHKQHCGAWTITCFNNVRWCHNQSCSFGRVAARRDFLSIFNWWLMIDSIDGVLARPTSWSLRFQASRPNCSQENLEYRDSHELFRPLSSASRWSCRSPRTMQTPQPRYRTMLEPMSVFGVTPVFVNKIVFDVETTP